MKTKIMMAIVSVKARMKSQMKLRPAQEMPGTVKYTETE